MFSLKERRVEILKKLAQKGSLHVHEVANEFGVSEITIRRDLIYLEKMGKVERGHGWVYPSNLNKFEHSFEERAKDKIQQKIVIAKEAKKLLKPGFVVFLDAGTTTLELAKTLEDINFELLIITNSLIIFNTVSRFSRIKNYLIGGELDEINFSLVGMIASRCIEQFYADIAFLGASAIDPEKGIFTVDTLGAETSRMMAKNSRMIVILADSSKFLKSFPINVIPMEDIDTIITDVGVAERVSKKIKSKGVDLKCVQV